jgi:Big-like domain-containing protein
MNKLWSRIAVALVTVAAAACTNNDSATNLNPAGPPMIEQVLMFENVADGAGIVRTNRVFAFGTHPLADPATEHEVTSAQAGGLSNNVNAFRVIIDELLVGNNLEEVQCRGIVDTDTFSRVPLGSTPDDVRACAGANDVLATTCTGAHAMCICQNATCVRNDNTTVSMGEPVGVEDENQDGNTDAHQFITSAVAIHCGAQDVALDPALSFWNPSGDQQKPAQGGFEALGPALVLVPSSLAPHFGALPTNTDCSFVFSPEVVDKDGINVCAPPDGDVKLDCTPGDVSAFHFRVEPFTVNPFTFKDNDTGVDRTQDIAFLPNVPVDATKLANITATQGGAAFTAFTATQDALQNGGLITIHATAGSLQANTVYTFTFPTTFTDTYGQPIPQSVTYTFTTGS